MNLYLPATLKVTQKVVPPEDKQSSGFTMWAFRNLSRAKISLSWNMDASLAPCRDIKAKPLSISLHPKKVEAFTACTKVIRLFGGIEFGIKGMKESVKKVPLVFIA